MNRRDYWDSAFITKAHNAVSWFELVPTLSLQLLDAAGLTPHTRVLDVGGGDSHLVDALLARGIRHVSVLDASPVALARAQARLREAASTVTWIEADVTATWSTEPVDIWHDRAVFHFLTEPHDRTRYYDHLRQTVKRGGAVVIATFALDGPERCSGLPIVRYSPDTLQAELGAEFRLVESVPHLHRTPSGGSQSFQYSRFERQPTP
jgi:SAM-dependent methyltransferase